MKIEVEKRKSTMWKVRKDVDDFDAKTAAEFLGIDPDGSSVL